MKPADLQIKVAELPSSGRILTGTLPVEWVTPSLLPAYTEASPLTLTLDVTPLDANVLVRGNFAITLTFSCSRTLAPGSVTLTIPLTELFSPGDAHSFDLLDDEISSDDLTDEPWVITDGLLDLEAYVREQLVLAQDPYPRVDAQAGASDDTATTLAWSSAPQGVDPRWERLANLKLD